MFFGKEREPQYHGPEDQELSAVLNYTLDAVRIIFDGLESAASFIRHPINGMYENAAAFAVRSSEKTQ